MLENPNANSSHSSFEDILKREEHVDLETTSNLAQYFFQQARLIYQNYKQEDPQIQNPSTVEALILILEDYKKLLKIFEKAPEIERLKLHCYFYLTTQEIYHICQELSRNIYSPLTIEYLVLCNELLKHNQVLMQPKYIEWLLKIQITIMQIFEDD